MFIMKGYSFSGLRLRVLLSISLFWWSSFLLSLGITINFTMFSMRSKTNLGRKHKQAYKSLGVLRGIPEEF